MSAHGVIRHVHTELMPGVELYVHAVVGERSSVIVDTGIAQMRDAVLGLARSAGASSRDGGLDYVLLTHAHADHTGCNRAVREASGAKVAAAGVDFVALWERVCAAMGEEREFRGYAMLEVQVDELVADGWLRREAGKIQRA